MNMSISEVLKMVIVSLIIGLVFVLCLWGKEIWSAIKRTFFWKIKEEK